MFAFTIFLFLALASLTSGSPLMTRDVWNPPITNPNEKTVWKVGDKVSVTWDVSNMPPVSQLTNPMGTVLLGFLTADNENLMIDSPLAKGFNLSDAQVQFTVPSVPTRNNYIVVVLGDSGNASPQFTIQGVGPALSSSTVGTSVIQPAASMTPAPSPSTTDSASEPTPPPSTTDSASKPTSTSPVPSSLSANTSSGASRPASTSSSVGSPQNSTGSAWKKCVDPTIAYSMGATVLALLTAL